MQARQANFAGLIKGFCYKCVAQGVMIFNEKKITTLAILLLLMRNKTTVFRLRSFEVGLSITGATIYKWEEYNSTVKWTLTGFRASQPFRKSKG